VTRRHASFLFALVAVACLLGAGCKSSTTSPTVGTISLTNQSGTQIVVYLDGTLELTLDNGAEGTISNVAPGTHQLVAKRADNGFLLKSWSLSVQAGGIYAMTIAGAASLLVTNNFSEILSIYQDGIYVGDIGPQVNETIYEISFGVHQFQAETKTDGTVVASTSIDFSDTVQYTWVISP
jgi:hypothetical protein